jgi:formylglycine-generating enzyme required for sulfatase activity
MKKLYLWLCCIAVLSACGKTEAAKPAVQPAQPVTAQSAPQIVEPEPPQSAPQTPEPADVQSAPVSQATEPATPQRVQRTPAVPKPPAPARADTAREIPAVFPQPRVRPLEPIAAPPVVPVTVVPRTEQGPRAAVGIGAVNFSPDGQFFLTAGADGRVHVWEAVTGKQILTLSAGSPAASVVFSPDSRQIALGCDNGSVQVWDIRSGDRVFSRPGGTLAAVQYLNARELAVLRQDGRLEALNTANGQTIRSADLGIGGIQYAAMSGEGRRLLYAKDGTAHLVDTASGREIRSFVPAGALPLQALALSRDGSLAAAAAGDRAFVWNAASGAEQRVVEGGAQALALSNDNSTLLVGAQDGTARMEDLKTGKELVRAISFDGEGQNEWVSMTPDGYYNASVHGDELFTIQAGTRSYTLSQFSEVLYRPDIVFQILNGQPPPPQQETLQNLVQDTNRPPQVEILGSVERNIDRGEARLPVKIRVMEGGIGSIMVYNGKVLTGLFNLEELSEKKEYGANGGIWYEAALNVPVKPGENALSVAVFNRQHSIASEPANIGITSSWKGPGNDKPTLHVLLMGIKEYKNSSSRLNLNLDFTLKDAEALEQLFRQQERGTLYSQVKIYKHFNQELTREGFSRIFTREVKPHIGPRDTFVFFFSGHGDVDTRGDFFLVPWDTEGVRNPVEKNIVKYDIVGNILKINAENTLILLDTCRSGSILEMETPFGRLIKDLEQKGILVAAAGDQFAIEDEELQHGVFTYSLLQGFQGGAVPASNRYIGTADIIGYVQQDVPERILRRQLGPGFEPAALATRILVVETPEERAVPHLEQRPLAMIPARDFTLIDRYLEPGKLTVTSRTAGTVFIEGTEGAGTPVSADVPLVKELYEGTYTVTIVYQNRSEKQSVNIRNNGSAAVNFSYRHSPPDPARFASIPGGRFIMGSPASESGRKDDEVQHTVNISGFYLGKYEVSQQEYETLMGSNPSHFKGPKLPVENVSWYDAVQYCNALSRKEGLSPAYTVRGDSVTWDKTADGYRLPTEAEWEYACRAGTATPFSTGAAIKSDQANYNGEKPYLDTPAGTYRETTTEAGSFAANPWGLYDMHGNVWEWCWDWQGSYPQTAVTDPAGAPSGVNRIERGGSWLSDGFYLRSAARAGIQPANRNIFLGFRVGRNM